MDNAAAFVTLALACAPLVHTDTTRALVAVESAFNPNAIGVVGGTLARQPASRRQAEVTAAHLSQQGWNYSLGLAQINRHNLDRLGLTTTTALDPCQNLRAMQTILLECSERAPNADDPQRALRQTLSCYYSGNFETGFRHGYVRRVVQAVKQR